MTVYLPLMNRKHRLWYGLRQQLKWFWKICLRKT